MTDISLPVQLLRNGKLVAFPTETVYGLGADATNDSAVKRIFEVKGRPSTNPLIVHVADEKVARRYASDWPKAASNLTKRFWPGPLTLVVPKAPAISPRVTAGLETVGLRAPDHPVALELLRGFDGAIAATSANRSTRVSPTTAQHVRDELGDNVDLILDGGPCTVGIESTVLDLTSSPPAILRPGWITAEQIEAVTGPVGRFQGMISEGIPASSPGQQAVHYAPQATAYRFDHSQHQGMLDWCQGHMEIAWAVLFLGPPHTALANHTSPTLHRLIQMPTAPSDYARRLYATLRELDEQGAEMIWVQMPPDQPQWTAIRDRLLRATRPAPL